MGEDDWTLEHEISSAEFQIETYEARKKEAEKMINFYKQKLQFLKKVR